MNRLRELGDRLDIRTVQGRGSFPTVLRQAGADDADMLVAVTSSDETNMIACQVAYTLFNTPTKIARVRESAYLTRSGLFDNEAIPVDVLISPEQVVTNYIKRLIEYPGALQVIEAWGDDVPDGVHTGFPMVVQKGEDEPVVFSIIVWPDKATRDAGQSAFMTDERVTGWDHNQAPFDGKRMIFGGFETLFSA